MIKRFPYFCPPLIYYWFVIKIINNKLISIIKHYKIADGSELRSKYTVLKKWLGIVY